MNDYNGMIVWTCVGAISTGLIAVFFTSILFHEVEEEIRTGQQYKKPFVIGILLMSITIAIVLVWISIGLWPSAIEESSPPYIRNNEFDPGQFGDQFGMVNSLFTGLALAGVLIAIMFQAIELRYQRAEMANTRKVFMNTYHLQAQQTYMSTLPEGPEKQQMARDLRETIRSIRLSGEIDDYQLFPIQSRAVLELDKIGFQGLIEGALAEADIENRVKRMDYCYGSLIGVDDRNVGNGILRDLVSSISDASLRLREALEAKKGSPGNKKVDIGPAMESTTETLHRVMATYKMLQSYYRYRSAVESRKLTKLPFEPHESCMSFSDYIVMRNRFRFGKIGR